MATGVDTESVNTHLDERAVAIDQVIGNSGVFSVQVHAVTSDLCPPSCVVVPVELTEVVPVVVVVVVLVVGVFHLLQPRVILLARGQARVIGRQFAPHRVGSVGEHALVDLVLVSIDVSREQFAQVLFAKVARVVQHHIEQDFHPTRVSLVDKRLERRVATLIAVINAREIARMVTVVIKSRSVLDNRCHPNRRESQSLDVIQFLDQTLEVAAPAGISAVGSARIPALGVVARVAVIEARRDHKIDTLVAKIIAWAHKRSPGLLCRQPSQQQQAHELENGILHLSQFLRIKTKFSTNIQKKLQNIPLLCTTNPQ